MDFLLFFCSFLRSRSVMRKDFSLTEAPGITNLPLRLGSNFLWRGELWIFEFQNADLNQHLGGAMDGRLWWPMDGPINVWTHQRFFNGCFFFWGGWGVKVEVLGFGWMVRWLNLSNVGWFKFLYILNHQTTVGWWQFSSKKVLKNDTEIRDTDCGTLP